MADKDIPAVLCVQGVFGPKHQVPLCPSGGNVTPSLILAYQNLEYYLPSAQDGDLWSSFIRRPPKFQSQIETRLLCPCVFGKSFLIRISGLAGQYTQHANGDWTLPFTGWSGSTLKWSKLVYKSGTKEVYVTLWGGYVAPYYQYSPSYFWGWLGWANEGGFSGANWKHPTKGPGSYPLGLFQWFWGTEPGAIFEVLSWDTTGA